MIASQIKIIRIYFTIEMSCYPYPMLMVDAGMNDAKPSEELPTVHDDLRLAVHYSWVTHIHSS